MTDEDYTDHLELLANTLAQTEPLVHSLEQAVWSIGPNVNADITEYECFKQKGAIFILSSKPLELVDQFTYLGSNISSTESNVSLVKTWNAIGRLSIIWHHMVFRVIDRERKSKESMLLPYLDDDDDDDDDVVYICVHIMYDVWLVNCVLWHINPCRLFNFKSSLSLSIYIYI